MAKFSIFAYFKNRQKKVVWKAKKLHLFLKIFFFFFFFFFEKKIIFFRKKKSKFFSKKNVIFWPSRPLFFAYFWNRQKSTILPYLHYACLSGSQTMWEVSLCCWGMFKKNVFFLPQFLSEIFKHCTRPVFLP